MKPIAISAGHHPQATGASNATHGLREYDYCIEIALRTVTLLCGWQVLAVFVPTGPLPSKIAYINDLQPLCAVEIHLNSATYIGDGTECLYSPGSGKGQRLASILQAAIVGHLGLRNRGVIERGDLGFLAKTSCPACITESLFLNNDDEVERFLLQQQQEGLDAIAQAHAQAILAYIDEEGE